MNSYTTYFPLITFFLIIMASGCSGTRPLTDIERATEFNDTNLREEDGHPEIRIAAMGFIDEHETGIISVTADIENRSLIYRHLDGKTTADIEMVITIIGLEEGEERYLDSFSENQTIENDTYGPLISADVTRYEKDIVVPPGQYQVFLSVTDQASDSQTVREVYATVPDPEKELVSVTPVQLFGKNSEKTGQDYEPITTYNVSTSNDSIRFVVQVASNQQDEPLILRSRLIHFESDTSVANSASHPNYSVSSLPYRGIDYRSEETLEETMRTLDQAGTVLIEFYIRRPERGNYRFAVTVENAEGNRELYRGRDFSVNGENFPRVESARELAEPLVYLMNQREHEELMAIEDPDELKEAVDRFWLENIGSVNRARRVIELYYERVEDANKQFSSYKEGWKTDRGMVYILFGPPSRIERWLNAQQWLGSYSTRDTRYNFLFQRTRNRSSYYPFENYMLQRSRAYHNYQYQQVQLWVTGQILNVHM